MPQTVQITVFDFEELSDDAKATARDWYRAGAFEYPWYETVNDDFEAICEIIGVDLKTSTVRLIGGGSRQKPCVYFSGFWSQGDGASFEGAYRYRKTALARLRAFAPRDKDLHQIAAELSDVQRRNFYQIEALVGRRGRYCHEYSMTIDVGRESPTGQGLSTGAEDAVKEGLRDLARWLYRQLEREYEHPNSDEAIDDAITANGYRFTESGAVYD